MNYKYPFAVYRDQNGDLKVIKREDLVDCSILALARSVRLYDEDEEYRLYPRARTGAPHFYCRTENRRRLVAPIEPDPRHNARRDSLLAALNSQKGLKLGYRDYFGSGPEDFEFFEIAEIEGYIWGKEVTRIMPYGLRVRHDVFGASPLLAMSERRPWIALEVIATHYLDDDTFQSLIDVSREMPLIVGFDLVEEPNYFLKLDEADGTLRLIYYIYDGSVWRNEVRTQIESGAALRAVLEREVRDKRARDARRRAAAPTR
ncbi:MAG TPA: hypothetical protein VHD62_08965 [Opitutaceae bacterium]|nr:hypothetical protein [Opitutaceae bacterium]